MTRRSEAGRHSESPSYTVRGVARLRPAARIWCRQELGLLSHGILAHCPHAKRLGIPNGMGLGSSSSRGARSTMATASTAAKLSVASWALNPVNRNSLRIGSPRLAKNACILAGMRRCSAPTDGARSRWASTSRAPGTHPRRWSRRSMRERPATGGRKPPAGPGAQAARGRISNRTAHPLERSV